MSYIKQIYMAFIWVSGLKLMVPRWLQLCYFAEGPLSKIAQLPSPWAHSFNQSRASHGRIYLYTVDCTSKLHSSTLGSRVWGKGDCGPFESLCVGPIWDCCKVSSTDTDRSWIMMMMIIMMIIDIMPTDWPIIHFLLFKEINFRQNTAIWTQPINTSTRLGKLRTIEP